jgi:hypothetical protein
MAKNSDEVGNCADRHVYQIRLSGQLASHWASRFEGMIMLADDNGDTTLIGPVADQAALHGLLKIVRDAGMTLISVNRAESNQP